MTPYASRDPPPAVLDSSDDDDDAALYSQVEFAGVATGDEFRSYKAAMSSPDAVRWRTACNDELLSLMSNNTWELVELPLGKRAINSGWVFKVKRNSDGSVERYKARLVAKGCSQRPGVDFNEVFAPTFRPAALRLILALAAAEDLHLRSIDISSAFTYGDLEEDIYMHQPEGFQEGGPNKVLKLKKSLYGLKQAASVRFCLSVFAVGSEAITL